MKMKNVTPQNALTPDDADKFWQYVLEWQVKLNLTNWRFSMSTKLPGPKAAAEVLADFEARTASFRLAVDFGPNMEVNDKTLEGLALHEVLHVFLKELIVMAQADETTSDVLASIEHGTIHTLLRNLAPGREI
jgi:hypothetical protein